MYSVAAYGKMILDAPRMDAYIRALRQAVRPGFVVVDLGCGPGLFALIACQLGARRVFAIEPNDAIQVGRDAAREHGFSDRIEFIQELSTNTTLPERADVVVSDLRGILPWFGHHIEAIVDARSRFLAPEGILIPRRDRLWAAIVEVPERYEEIVKPWSYNGLTLSSARNLAVNTWSKIRVKRESLLGQPVCWHELDYRTMEEVNFRKDISFTANRRGTAHGLVVWFDAELFDGIGFSNAPGAEELIYGQAFFPFKVPFALANGDRVDVRLEARLIGDDYVWRWNDQSTLLGVPLSISELHKRVKKQST